MESLVDVGSVVEEDRQAPGAVRGGGAEEGGPPLASVPHVHLALQGRSLITSSLFSSFFCIFMWCRFNSAGVNEFSQK